MHLPAIIRRTLRGAVFGFVATVPMSLAMLALQRTLPARERYRLPPEEITRRTAERAGVGDKLREPEQVTVATVMLHFGYGAACGGLYALAPRPLAVSPAPWGIVFGVIVWAISYLGWLPAAGLFPHAARRSAGRNAVMIAAHVVWGATLGALSGNRGSDQGSERSDAGGRATHVGRRSPTSDL